MLPLLFGNIWRFARRFDWVVVPTNIGWTKRGEAVMGMGIAGQAAKFYPDLKIEYGDFCMKHGENTPVVQLLCKANSGTVRGLILFPTKPLNKQRPQLSWQGDSDLGLVTRSLDQLRELGKRHEQWLATGGRVLTPLVGCGHGRLEENVVLPLMAERLVEDFYFLVRQRDTTK